MQKVLILTGRYLPGHKDGGPLRTLINVTDALGDEFDFYIGCLDRDHGDLLPYPNILKNEWNSVGKAKVWYVEPGGFTRKMILKLAKGMDCIYLCSFYDDYGYKTLYLKRKGLIDIPVTLASMGVFSEGALSHKSFKKACFINACKFFGLFNNVIWSVTSEIEAEDLYRVIGKEAKCVIAEDLPRSIIPGLSHDKHDNLKIAFLSRICEHKGLDIAIDAIKNSNIRCTFTIYGPIQESDYWSNCKNELSKSDVEWNYGGDVDSEDVQEVLSHEDILILPTKSENYGHVIFEALSVGCIPMISDTTPWSTISDEDCGFVLPRTTEAFIRALENLDMRRLAEMKPKAVCFARNKVNSSTISTGYRILFNRSKGNESIRSMC